MRARLIRPEYWTDEDLHTRLNADQREFYQGLWMLADDAGYVAWDPPRMGAQLYPYVAHDVRVANILAWVVALADHVALLDCGRHLVIPSLPRWQTPPRPSDQHRRAHQGKCRPIVLTGSSGGQLGPGGARDGQVATAGKVSEGKVSEGKGGPRDGGSSEPTTTEFRQRMASASATGGKAP